MGIYVPLRNHSVNAEPLFQLPKKKILKRMREININAANMNVRVLII